MVNPVEALPGYGAILKNRCKLNTQDEGRTFGDLYAAVLDYLIRQAWSLFGLWPEEEENHRDGFSILEVQEFLDWAMTHLVEDMNWDLNELDREFAKGVEKWKNSLEKDD